MIVTEKLPVEDLDEFNVVTSEKSFNDKYPRIIVRINRISPEFYQLTVDDNNEGNAKAYLIDVFDRMGLK